MIQVTSNIIASSSGCVMEDIEQKGGFRIVEDLNAMLAIKAGRRKAGMLVYVSDTDTIYKLINNPENGSLVIEDWAECLPSVSESDITNLDWN